MPRRTAGGTDIHIGFTAEEKANIALQAASRNLNNSTFIKLIVLGAIARGGGTVEQLLAAGETHMPNIRKRASINYVKMWERTGTRQYTRGDWVLTKNTRSGHVNTQKDVTKWWWLHHKQGLIADQPLSFLRADAMEQAIRIIERMEDDSIADERNL